MKKIHCSTRKNTNRNSQFILELTPQTRSVTTNLSKNLLFGREFTVWLCVLYSSDKLLTPINCCKTHHQPNSFIHSLTNLLYWAYWAHILFYLGLGYDLWPYKCILQLYLCLLPPNYTSRLMISQNATLNLFKKWHSDSWGLYNYNK